VGRSNVATVNDGTSPQRFKDGPQEGGIKDRMALSRVERSRLLHLCPRTKAMIPDGSISVFKPGKMRSRYSFRLKAVGRERRFVPFGGRIVSGSMPQLARQLVFSTSRGILFSARRGRYPGNCRPRSEPLWLYRSPDFVIGGRNDPSPGRHFYRIVARCHGCKPSVPARNRQFPAIPKVLMMLR